MNTNYREPSAAAGSDIQISEPGLARPVLNPTGGKRSYSKRSYSKRSYSRQRGSGVVGAPLSYMNVNYREPSAAAGSDIQISEPGLARPVLNPTGGNRKHVGGADPTPPTSLAPATTVSSASCPCRGGRRSRRSRKQRRRRGGFYPSVMGNFVSNASRLAPAVAITGYRMIKNYNKTRKNRK